MIEKKTCCIFCPVWDINESKLRQAVKQPALFIAADSGIASMEALGFIPDVIIGDLDSAPLALLSEPKYKDIPRIIHPTEKDDTDLMLAVKYALDNGCRDIIIIGGIGGRLDHTLANLMILEYIHKRNAAGTITDGKTKVRYLSGDSLEVRRGYKYISLIPLREHVNGITLTGFDYPLDNACLSMSEPYTVSNRLADGQECGIISVSGGAVLVVECDE